MIQNAKLYEEGGETMLIDPHIIETAKSIESFLKMPEESDFLIREAEKAQLGIIEVGSWTGRSSVLLAAVAREKGIPFVAVDTWESCDLEPDKDFFPTWKANMVKAGLLPETWNLLPDNRLYSYDFYVNCSQNRMPGIGTLRMPSSIAARVGIPLLYAAYPRDMSFDLCFIDADHEYESVKQDFFAWIPNLVRPATVVLHDVDCGHLGVKKFFSELAAGGLVTEKSGNIGLVRLL
jgi:hypothetical protein